MFVLSRVLLLYFPLAQLPPYIIFKAKPAPPGKSHGHKNTVTYEIFHNIADQWGNKYPMKADCVCTVSETANSNGLLTLDVLNQVFSPYLGIKDGKADHCSLILVDDFRGHSDKRVKACTQAMGNILKWEIMAGGITPKAQPLDVVINKVFKGFFRDLFEQWSLNAPLNEKSGNPLPPSRQLLAKWVVLAWSKVDKALVKKSWKVCGYRTMEDLEDIASGNSAVVQWSGDSLGRMVDATGGPNAALHFLHDPENEPEPLFPDVSGAGDSDDNDSDDEDVWQGHGYDTRTDHKPVNVGRLSASEMHHRNCEMHHRNCDMDHYNWGKL